MAQCVKRHVKVLSGVHFSGENVMQCTNMGPENRKCNAVRFSYMLEKYLEWFEQIYIRTFYTLVPFLVFSPLLLRQPEKVTPKVTLLSSCNELQFTTFLLCSMKNREERH